VILEQLPQTTVAAFSNKKTDNFHFRNADPALSPPVTPLRQTLDVGRITPRAASYPLICTPYCDACHIRKVDYPVV
jgi:hypothetical protein